MTEIGWEVDEEVNQDKIGEADGMNLEVDSKDEVMHRFKLALKTFLFATYLRIQRIRGFRGDALYKLMIDIDISPDFSLLLSPDSNILQVWHIIVCGAAARPGPSLLYQLYQPTH